MLALLAVYTIYVSIEDQRREDRDQRQAACQAQFNADFAKVVAVRNVYAEEDRDENIKMWDALLSPTATQATRLRAAQEFTAAMHRNSDLRARNPLPKLEDRNC